MDHGWLNSHQGHLNVAGAASAAQCFERVTSSDPNQRIGIPMIELIASNAYRRLNELSVGSVKINAAVCYWTMPPGDLASAFISALRHEESCLVVDIHSPTSIDSLAKLNIAGAHIYLYLFQIIGKTEVADSKGIPDHLMHAKVFVFDYGTSEIKIWVGSHNGTRRALLGLNFEFASVITCERNSDLHLKALRFIDEIRNISVAFKQSEIDLYRTIQGGLQIDAFIELQEPRVLPLANRSVLSIFGTREADYTQLQKVGKSIFLSITDSSSGVEAIYKASIDQTGYLNKRRNDLKFDSRRFAVKDGASIPVLEIKQAIPASVYAKCRYFVTLKIDSPVLGQDAMEAPEGSLWVDVKTDRYLQGARQPIFDEAPIVTGDREIGRFRVQGVNLGQAESIFDSPPVSELQRSLRVLNLSERRSLGAHPLIRRRILVDRPVSKPQTHPEAGEEK